MKIEEYIKLGEFNRLEFYKEVDFGIYLRSKEENDEVLLPSRYVPVGIQMGDTIDVFVYMCIPSFESDTIGSFA
jgi:predicted RNA-binding protein (virulence factor B family)